MDKLIFKQPRESRLVAGVITLVLGSGLFFFSMLVALESFSDSPFIISLFLLLGILLVMTGFYFSLCTPYLKFDIHNQRITHGQSCLLMNTRTSLAFSEVREVGINERYLAGDRTEASGTTYTVELRAQSNITLPGSQSDTLQSALDLADEVATTLGCQLETTPRQIMTGSFKI